MNRIISTISCLLLFTCCLIQGQDTIRIEPGQCIEKELSQNENHTFLIDLDARKFVYGYMSQKDVNVRILIFDTTGNQVGTFNMITGQEGFYIVSNDGGRYKIVVTPIMFSTPRGSGIYSLEIKPFEPLGETPGKKLDQILKALYKEDGPGGAMVITRNGKIIYSRAYGSANVTYGIPFTMETPSNIGSVSKQFTGFAIALLEKEGKLSFNDDIRKYIPDCPDFGEPVTLLHLLHHTSGYREINTTFHMRNVDPLTREDLIQQIQKQTELQNAPGSEYRYVNTGYILLAEVVQKVSGVSFRDWMQKHIFIPLGMENSTVNSPLIALIPRVVPNSAQGYMKYSGEYGYATDELAIYGASGIYSNASDLSKWLMNYGDPKIGGKEVISKMTARGLLTGGDSVDYGFGLQIEDYQGLKRFRHSGFDGFHWTEMAYYPDIDVGIIILNNFPIFSTVTDKVSELFLQDDYKPLTDSTNKESEEEQYFEVDQSLLDAYAGRYSAEEDDRMIVTFERNYNKLSVNVRTNILLPKTFMLDAISDTTFVKEDLDISITFHLDANRQVRQAHFHYDDDFILHRIPPYEPTEKDLLSFTGIYYSQELESVYTLFVENDRLSVKHPGGFTTSLEPMYQDTFSGRQLGEYLFERSDDGNISGFIVKSVHFEKLK
jgi:CubicO group peptidase (beta-lactamase class C family)